MTPLTAPLASRTLQAITADGETFEMLLAIGAPREGGLGDWACTVQVTRLVDESRDIFGIDAWQALLLAYQVVEQALEAFLANGGTLFWPESDTPVTLAGLFQRPAPKDRAA